MHARSRLALVFRDAASLAFDEVRDDAVEDALVAYVDTARSAWPNFGIDAEEIVRYVAACGGPRVMAATAIAGRRSYAST